MKLTTSVSFVLALGLSASASSAVAPASSPEIIAKGKKSFATNCASCHGEGGEGNGPMSKLLGALPRNLKSAKYTKGEKVEDIFKTLSDGLEGTPMAAFKQLSDDERWALAHYVRTFKGSKKK